MQNFSEATKLFRESKFYDAYNKFLIALNEEALTREDKISCCENILKIGSILNIKINLEIEETLANNFFEVGEFEKSASHFLNLLSRKRSSIYFYKIWKSYWCAGDLSKSAKVAEEYMYFLQMRKNIEPGLEFLDELNVGDQKREGLRRYKIRLEMIRGNANVAKDLCDELEKLFTLNQREALKAFEYYKKVFESRSHYWNHFDFFRNCKAHYYSAILENGEFLQDDIDLRKEMTKLIFDLFLNSQIVIGKKLLCSYVAGFKRRRLGEILEAVEPEMLEKSGIVPLEYKKEKDIQVDVDLNVDETFDEENLEVKKLERDIKFLMGSEDEATLLQLQNRLKKLDPENALLEGKTDQSSFRLKRKEVEEVKRNLLLELSVYGNGEKREDDNRISESILASLSDEDIRKNYKDLVYSLNTLEMYDASLKILGKIRLYFQTIEDIRSEITAHYLELMTLWMKGDLVKALDIALDALNYLPLTKDEIFIFQFEYARLLLLVGKATEARKILKSIEITHGKEIVTKALEKEFE